MAFEPVDETISASAPATNAMPQVPAASHEQEAEPENFDSLLGASQPWEEAEEPVYEQADRRTPVKKGRSPWTTPLIVLLILVVLAVLGALLLPHADRQQVPRTELDEHHRQQQRSSSESTTSSAPTTEPTTQSPSPSSSAPTTATVIAATYVGRDVARATASLERLGFKVSTVEEPSSEKAGIVLDVSPTGEQALGSTITLKVAAAQALVQVPNLFGSTVDEAESELKSVGLVPKAGTPREDPRAYGTVIDQFPTTGTKVEPNTVITFIWSLGPAKETSTPTPTQSSTPSTDEVTPPQEGDRQCS